MRSVSCGKSFRGIVRERETKERGGSVLEVLVVVSCDLSLKRGGRGVGGVDVVVERESVDQSQESTDRLRQGDDGREMGELSLLLLLVSRCNWLAGAANARR